MVRLGLAAVWLFAGVPKLLDLNQNYVAVQAYELLPSSAVSIVATAQPFLEVALGVLLIVGIGTRAVAIISGLLLLVYIGGIVSVWARGLSIDCGCFSAGGQVAAGETHYGLDIARDVGYLLLAAWLVWRPRTLVSFDGVLAGGTRAGEQADLPDGRHVERT